VVVIGVIIFVLSIDFAKVCIIELYFIDEVAVLSVYHVSGSNFDEDVAVFKEGWHVNLVLKVIDQGSLSFIW